MNVDRSSTNRHLLGALAFVALSCFAQSTATLPAELEPYFNAIRMVESKNHPWSIYDNTSRQSYRLASRAEAEAKAAELIQYGHNVDLGLMQLNCKYQCKRPGVGLANIFDPQINVNTAKIIFMEFWDQARRISTDFNARVMATVGAYNNGRVGTPNVDYVRKVWQQLGKPVGDIPDAGSGKPEQAATNKGFMDEALGRASKGVDWARARLDELTNSGKKDPNTAQSQEGNRREAVTQISVLGAIVSVFAIGAGLFFLAPVLVPMIKLLGGGKAVARFAARKAAGYAKKRSKATSQEMNT